MQGSLKMASIRSTGPETGTVQVLRSRGQTPINHFGEGRNFLDLPSTTGSESNHYALDEHCHSLGKMNGQANERMDYSVQECSDFHPCSLPEFNDRLSNGGPYNFSVPSVGVKSNGAMDAGHIYRGGSGNFSNQSSTHTEGTNY
jgi:hypothetical protein